MGSIDLQRVVAAVGESKRYRHVAPGVVQRLAAEEIGKSRNQADAEKRTKRRLHQIFGAYHTPVPYEPLLQRLTSARDDPTEFKKACVDLLRAHASTAERLPELERGFYQQIFATTGTPRSVLDLACGLNPVALPWMDLPAATRYLACEIDQQMARFLNGFFRLVQVEGRAMLNDLVAGPPTEVAEVALLLKTLPCLQHQTADLASLIERIRAPQLVISFPTRSLGNISKGMTTTYREMFASLARGRAWAVRELQFVSELVFIVQR